MRVIHIVKMIYNVSHHYNTPERVASLLVKITNQVSKNHLKRKRNYFAEWPVEIEKEVQKYHIELYSYYM